MAYAVKNDISGKANEFTIPSGYDDGEVGQLISDAQDIIDKITRDHFETHQLTLYVNGTGKKTLFLAHYTLEDYLCDGSIAITEREDYGGAWLAENDLLATDFVAYKSRIEAAAQYISNVRVSDKDGNWTLGQQNYRIIGNFGWSAVPSAIKLATVHLVREWIQPGYSRNLDMAEEWWLDYRYRVTHRIPENITGTGIVYVDRLLLPYVKKKIGIGAV